MKAETIQYSKDGAISVLEHELGDPGPGEIQVQGAACGICSWDIATCKMGTAMSIPAPPGHEGVGYVHKVGAGVQGFQEGDRVLGIGFQTYVNLPSNRLCKIPESKLPDECWLVEPVSCVVTGMDTARLRVGDRVALIGCGFMGLIFAQMLARSPLARVVAMDIDGSRLAKAKSFGISETHDLSKGLDDKLLADLRGEEGFDVVVDTSGTQPGLDASTKLVRRGGQINLFGWIKGTQAVFDPSAWHVNGYSIVNSSPSSQVRDPVPPAIRLIEKGTVDLSPMITHVVGLHDYAALMNKIIAGDPTYIKGVVKLF
jgi:threonine dehydrogenase-like Zn-dependent dehydrogenase